MAPVIQGSTQAMKTFMKTLRKTNKAMRQDGVGINEALPLSYSVPGGGLIKATAGKNGMINLKHSVIPDKRHLAEDFYEVTTKLKKPKYTGSKITSKEGTIELDPGKKRFLGLIKTPDMAFIETKFGEAIGVVGNSWKNLKSIIRKSSPCGKEASFVSVEKLKEVVERILNGGYKL